MSVLIAEARKSPLQEGLWVLLMLALTRTTDRNEIQRIFSEY